MQKFAPLLLLTLISQIGGTSVQPAAAQSSGDARDRQIWERFVKSEKGVTANDRGVAAPPSPGTAGGFYNPPGDMRQGSFSVPGAFMPPVYERPVELFRDPLPGDFNYNPQRSAVPWGLLSNAGWSLGMSNVPSIPGLGGFGGFGGGMGSLSGLGLGGFGGLGGGLASTLLGGMGSSWRGGGYGGYGGYSGNLGYGAGSALYPTLFAGSGYGGNNLGNGWRPAGFGGGGMGRPAVYQMQPSKPSGNYYQPSTVDSTASGSYYAQTGPSALPVIESTPAPKDYWGPNGNPFGNAWNVPAPN